MDYFIIISIMISFIAVFYVWYISKPFRHIPSTQILDLDGTDNKLLSTWYNNNVKSSYDLELNSNHIASKYLKRHFNINIDPNFIVIGNYIDNSYHTITGKHLILIPNQSNYSNKVDCIFDLRSLLGIDCEIAIIHDPKIKSLLKSRFQNLVSSNFLKQKDSSLKKHSSDKNFSGSKNLDQPSYVMKNNKKSLKRGSNSQPDFLLDSLLKSNKKHNFSNSSIQSESVLSSSYDDMEFYNSESRIDSNIDLTFLNDIINCNLDHIASKYLKENLEFRWNKILELTDSFINSFNDDNDDDLNEKHKRILGSYLYLPINTNYSEKIVEIIPGVNSFITPMGARINLLCSDLEFSTFLKRWSSYLSNKNS